MRLASSGPSSSTSSARAAMPIMDNKAVEVDRWWHQPHEVKENPANTKPDESNMTKKEEEVIQIELKPAEMEPAFKKRRTIDELE